MNAPLSLKHRWDEIYSRTVPKQAAEDECNITREDTRRHAVARYWPNRHAQHGIFLAKAQGMA
jgi:hypothetical protein